MRKPSDNNPCIVCLKADSANQHPGLCRRCARALDPDRAGTTIADLIVAVARRSHRAQRRKVNADTRELDRARARITALKVATRWRPMSEAPKNATEIAALTDQGRTDIVTWFTDEDSAWWGGYHANYRPTQLLGWLPIPAPTLLAKGAP